MIWHNNHLTEERNTLIFPYVKSSYKIIYLFLRATTPVFFTFVYISLDQPDNFK